MKSKDEIVRAVAREDADRVLVAHALDKLEACRARDYQTFTRFLDLRERAMVDRAVQLAGGADRVVFTGGYPDAERVCAVFYPAYWTAQDAASPEHTPLTVLRAEISAFDTPPSHRDYLGALLGLGITRACIGDLLVQPEGGADLIVLEEIADFLQLHLEKAGRCQCTLRRVPLDEMRVTRDEGETREYNVASMRLDSVAAAVFGLSRAQARALVERGQVFVNQETCGKAEREIHAGDRVTVRGMGRARVLELCGVSRKGRQFIRCTRSR